MELAYKEFGQGKPVIILHGVFGSSDNWITIGKRLSKSRHVYIPDQRNHGDSSHSDALNYDVLANDLLDFIMHHKIERPILIGHSMGGKTAMKFAVNHPDLFDKLVVVDIGPKAYIMRHDKVLDALNAIDLKRLKSRRDFDEQLQNSLPEPRVRQFMLKNLRKKGHHYEWKINLSAITRNMEKLGEGLEERAYTDKPVLFIRGGNSDYVLDQDSITIVSLFPNSEIVTIPGASHWIHVEKPEEFLNIVEQFIG
jgi:esterase